MTGVEKVNIENCRSLQNIKNLLGYAVRKRRGYYEDIKLFDEHRGDTLEMFKYVGFINTGHTLKNETYSITNLGNDYYKEFFGTYSYLKKRLAGLYDRFKADLIYRLSE